MLLAPLAGYTDLPFRRQCRKFGCYYAFTPLVEAGSVVYRNPRSSNILLRGDDEPWLGIQILSAKPPLLLEAVERLSDYTYDVIDFNMGCFVPKVVKRGAGAALMEKPDLALRCLDRLVVTAPWPVTAKIRILDTVDPKPTVDVARRLENCGIRALTIHGRHRSQGYSGEVSASIISAVHSELKIPVIANGGVFDRESADELRHRSGCSRLMAARGAIGNPWIFRELADSAADKPAHKEICEVMREHVLEMIEIYGEKAGLRNARKIILAYLVGRGYPRKLRAQVSAIVNRNQFEDFYRLVCQSGICPD